jgi:hypothetical protein
MNTETSLEQLAQDFWERPPRDELKPEVDIRAMFQTGNNWALPENRTVKIQGQGYGSSPATISAVQENHIIMFTGEIPTVDQAVPAGAPSSESTLFTFPLAVTGGGVVPIGIRVFSGTMVISNVLADHNSIEPAGATDPFYRINSHTGPGPAWLYSHTGLVWRNVTIDEVAQPDSDFYTVNAGSTIWLSLNVFPGRYTTLCPAPVVPTAP